MSSSVRIARTFLVVALCGGLAPLASADDPAIVKTVVVLEGDSIPGAGPVRIVTRVDVNDSGETLVEVDTDAPIGIDRVLLANGAPFLQEGQPLGMPSGATVGGFGPFALNDAGKRSTILYLDGTSGLGDDSGIYVDETLRIQEGDVATAVGFPANTPFQAFIDAKINQSGDLLVLGTAGASLEYLMIVDPLGGQTLVLREGDPVPGVPGVSVSGFGSSPLPESTSFNDQGNVLYFVDSDAPTGEDGLVMLDQEVLAREGSPSPVAGRLWSSLSNPELSLNGSRDFVFSGRLDGDSASEALIVKNGAKFRQTRDSLRAIAPFRLTSFGTAPVRVQERGARTADPAVLWFGDWNDPDFNVDTGLFLDDKLLFQEGVSTVDGMTVDVIGSASGSIAMSDNGRYVLVDVALLEVGSFDGIDAAVLLDLGPWRDLGKGFAGSTAPKLRCFGQLAAGTPLTLEVSNAPPSSPALIVFGSSRVDQPFLGATLVPSPDRLLPNVPVDANGSLSVSFTVPPSFQPGAAAYFQVWIHDPNSPIGFSVTNGVEGIGS